MQQPDASRRHRKLLWLLGVLALPSLSLGADLLLERLGNAAVLVGAAGYTGTVMQVLLYGAAALLMDQGLRIFVWDSAYPRRRTPPDLRPVISRPCCWRDCLSRFR